MFENTRVLFHYNKKVFYALIIIVSAFKTYNILLESL